MAEHSQERPQFEPLRRPNRRRWRLALAVGTVLWLVSLIIVAGLLRRGEAIQQGLLIAAGGFALGLLVLIPQRYFRVKRERAGKPR